MSKLEFLVKWNNASFQSDCGNWHSKTFSDLREACRFAIKEGHEDWHKQVQVQCEEIHSFTLRLEGGFWVLMEGDR